MVLSKAVRKSALSRLRHHGKFVVLDSVPNELRPNAKLIREVDEVVFGHLYAAELTSEFSGWRQQFHRKSPALPLLTGV